MNKSRINCLQKHRKYVNDLGGGLWCEFCRRKVIRICTPLTEAEFKRIREIEKKNDQLF